MFDSDKFLIEWMIRFLKNKDVIKKEIISIENKNDQSEFTVQYKDKTKFFILMTYLEKSIFNRINNNENCTIITLNNNANVEFMINNWNEFHKFISLSVYFINPFSKLDKVWVIVPHVHDKICESSSLSTGLKSMAEMVEETDERDLEINLKSKAQELDL